MSKSASELLKEPGLTKTDRVLLTAAVDSGRVRAEDADDPLAVFRASHAKALQDVFPEMPAKVAEALAGKFIHAPGPSRRASRSTMEIKRYGKPVAYIDSHAASVAVSAYDGSDLQGMFLRRAT